MESNTNKLKTQSDYSSEPIGFLNILKAAYLDKSYIFWGINLFCFIILFFVLDKNSGGSYGVRLFVVMFCIVVGGFLGVLWSVNRNGGRVSWFKYGSGTFLVIITLMLWAGNGKYDSNGNYKSPYEGYSSTQNYDCPHCSGSGKRMNNTTGRYGSCYSCGGDGYVSSEQYKRLSK